MVALFFGDKRNDSLGPVLVNLCQQNLGARHAVVQGVVVVLQRNVEGRTHRVEFMVGKVRH